MTNGPNSQLPTAKPSMNAVRTVLTAKTVLPKTTPKEFIEIFGGHNDGFLVSSEIYTKAWTKWLRFLKGYEKKAERHRASLF